MRPYRCLAGLFVCLCWAVAGTLDTWVPARWDGGPLEIVRRARDKAFAKTLADAAVREAIEQWYDPETLGLLEGTPINCLLVTFSAGADPAIERRQQQLVVDYARLARKRGLAVLGLIYPGADPEGVAAAAADAHLDGLVLEGDFPGEAFPVRLKQILASANSAALVIRIARGAAAIRARKAPLAAVQGVRPDARNPADMGIRSGPSGEPWIASNIWLVRSFRLSPDWRPVWISQQPDVALPGDYIRCAADAAVAGGRWIVALDDGLRAKLRRGDCDAVAAWRKVAIFLQFAEDHADWRRLEPYGNVAVVLDQYAAEHDVSDEYLNLVARRQVPYRLILRSQLDARALAGYQAVLAVNLAPPNQSERKVLSAFAAQGGIVIAGPSWGDAPKNEPYAEIALSKGRLVVYKDDPPDPDAVARDLKDLLSPEQIGITVFNTPSVLTYASTGESGKCLLVQLLNYSSYPVEAVTVRVNGNFTSARWYVPDATPVDLSVKKAGGRTEVYIPKLAVWGGVVLR